MKKVVFDIETAQIEQRIMRTLGKKQQLGAMYGMGAEAIRAAYGGGCEPRWANMRQIGGKVTITGNRFTKQQKLFVAKGKATGLVYVKTARRGFVPLCVDGTMSNGSTWSELEIPEDYRRTDVPGEGGHVTVMNIVDAARERILTGEKPLVDWQQTLKGFMEAARKP